MAAIAISAAAASVSLIALLVQSHNSNREFRRSVRSANYNERLAAYSAALAALTKNMSLISSWAAADRDPDLAQEVGPIFVELERARSELAATREVAQLTGPEAVSSAFLAAEQQLRRIILATVQGRLPFDDDGWKNEYGVFDERRDAYARACQEELTRVKRRG